MRPGPKPKPLEARKYTLRGPIKRIERVYPRERKIEVIIMRHYYRVPYSRRYKPDEIVWLPPKWEDMEKFWKIPKTTMQTWWENRVKIINSLGEGYQTVIKERCEWPLLEIPLYKDFEDRRKAGHVVRRSWFRRRAKKIYKDIYGEEKQFIFSNSWFQGFCRRWKISLRALTHKVKQSHYYLLILARQIANNLAYTGLEAPRRIQ
jgi:hypothetical protein